MPSEINVPTDPVLVYAMVGVLIGALVLALVFARPRRGLGAATKADAARTPADEAWMPGGDIFGHEKPAPEPSEEAPTYPTFPDLAAGALPTAPPAAHDPWSTTDQAGQQPRWDRS